MYMCTCMYVFLCLCMSVCWWIYVYKDWVDRNVCIQVWEPNNSVHACWDRTFPEDKCGRFSALRLLLLTIFLVARIHRANVWFKSCHTTQKKKNTYELTARLSDVLTEQISKFQIGKAQHDTPAILSSTDGELLYHAKNDAYVTDVM